MEARLLALENTITGAINNMKKKIRFSHLKRLSSVDNALAIPLKHKVYQLVLWTQLAGYHLVTTISVSWITTDRDNYKVNCTKSL